MTSDADKLKASEGGEAGASGNPSLPEAPLSALNFKPIEVTIKRPVGRPRKHAVVAKAIAAVPASEGEQPGRNKFDGVPVEKTRINYEPHPKQVRFGEAIKRGARIILFIAGIRSGKSWAGAYECLKQVYIYGRMPNLGYIVSPTINMSRVPRRLFLQAAGDTLIRYKRASDDGPAHALLRPSPSLPTHSYTVEFHTGEHADRLRGASVAWAWLDEAAYMKPEVFDVVRGRMIDTKGIIIITTSPTSASHWVKTEVYDRAARCGQCDESIYDHPADHEPRDVKGDPKIAVIRCSTFDNSYLPQEEIEELKRDYTLKDPIIARRELYAEFAGFEGLIYSSFDRRTHTSPYNHLNLPPTTQKIVCGVDFGVNDPFVVAFLAKVNGGWHVVDEYYYAGAPRSMEEHFRAIKAKALFKQVDRWWFDPSNPQAGIELMRLGIKHIHKARKQHTTGKNWRNYRIDVLNSWMRSEDAAKRPLFQIGSDCSNVRRDFESRKWKRYMTRGEDGLVRIIDRSGKNVDRNAGDEPASGFDHGTDAVEYALCSEEVTAKYKARDPNSDPNRNPKDANGQRLSPEQEEISTHLTRELEKRRESVLSGRMRRAGVMHPAWSQ